MKLTICDDEIREVKALREICEKYIEIHRLNIEISGITEPEQISKERPDILILDVEMPGENGIEIKDRLALNREGPLIIFATNYAEASSKAFNRNVIGFLVKPVEQEQLFALLDVAIALLSVDRVITFDDGSVASTKDVIWVTANKGYSDFLLKSGKTKDGGKKPIKYWEEQLGSCGFIRINEGILVNCRHIKAYYEDAVILNNYLRKNDSEPEAIKMEISRRRKKICKDMYLDYCKKTAKY